MVLVVRSELDGRMGTGRGGGVVIIVVVGGDVGGGYD